MSAELSLLELCRTVAEFAPLRSNGEHMGEANPAQQYNPTLYNFIDISSAHHTAIQFHIHLLEYHAITLVATPT